MPRELFHYTGYFHRAAMCDVEIHKVGDVSVVVATEREDNPGRSVTNSWPELADEICRQFQLQEPIVWVEHYPAHHGADATWDKVHLECLSPGHYRMAMSRNTHEVGWTPLYSEDFDQYQINRE